MMEMLKRLNQTIETIIEEQKELLKGFEYLLFHEGHAPRRLSFFDLCKHDLSASEKYSRLTWEHHVTENDNIHTNTNNDGGDGDERHGTSHKQMKSLIFAERYDISFCAFQANIANDSVRDLHCVQFLAGLKAFPQLSMLLILQQTIFQRFGQLSQILPQDFPAFFHVLKDYIIFQTILFKSERHTLHKTPSSSSGTSFVPHKLTFRCSLRLDRIRQKHLCLYEFLQQFQLFHFRVTDTTHSFVLADLHFSHGQHFVATFYSTESGELLWYQQQHQQFALFPIQRLPNLHLHLRLAIDLFGFTFDLPSFTLLLTSHPDTLRFILTILHVEPSFLTKAALTGLAIPHLFDTLRNSFHFQFSFSESHSLNDSSS